MNENKLENTTVEIPDQYQRSIEVRELHEDELREILKSNITKPKSEKRVRIQFVNSF